MNSLKNIKSFKPYKLLLLTIFVLPFSGKILSDEIHSPTTGRMKKDETLLDINDYLLKVINQ